MTSPRSTPKGATAERRRRLSDAAAWLHVAERLDRGEDLYICTALSYAGRRDLAYSLRKDLSGLTFWNIAATGGEEIPSNRSEYIAPKVLYCLLRSHMAASVRSPRAARGETP